MTIWGNHSSTQYPDLFHAEVDGKNAAASINDQTWLEGRLFPPLPNVVQPLLKPEDSRVLPVPPTPR